MFVKQSSITYSTISKFTFADLWSLFTERITNKEYLKGNIGGKSKQKAKKISDLSKILEKFFRVLAHYNKAISENCYSGKYGHRWYLPVSLSLASTFSTNEPNDSASEMETL